MIVRRFMNWITTAGAAERAQGAAALARAFLNGDVEEADREEAEIALTALLDDASPLVRKAMAQAFAVSAGAPHAIVVALANDQSDIAAPVLGYSPLLSDAELIDCAAIGDAFAQSSIAIRPVLSGPVAAALAEVGCREALIALAVNPGAVIPDFSARRMVERFGDDAELRESLLARSDLSAATRADLVAATARALAAFVDLCGWAPAARMSRVVREACDRAHVIIAADVDQDADCGGARALVAHLRQSGQLTASLILRAVLSGNSSLFEAAMVELSGLPPRKALALARQPQGAGFASVFRAAGLPPALLPAFQAALSARKSMPRENASPRLSRAMIAQVIGACEAINEGEMNALLALLRRFEAEAAREDARDAVEEMRAPHVRLFPPFEEGFGAPAERKALPRMEASVG